MKHLSILLFLAFIALLSSCTTHYICVTSYMDYSKYADEGFFITEASTVPFSYTPVGSMTVSEFSGKDENYTPIESTDTKSNKEFDNLYGSVVPKPNHWREATAKTALAAIVERAKTLGANGIMGIRIETVYKKDDVIGYTVSGMLIKR